MSNMESQSKLIHAKAMRVFQLYWNKYHGSYSIENPLMPNMHITRNEWRQFGKKVEPSRVAKPAPNYCKYCTTFLIENSAEDAEDPCHLCPYRREEQSISAAVIDKRIPCTIQDNGGDI